MGVSMSDLINNFDNILLPALIETLYMSLVSTLLGFVLAIVPGVLLCVWDKEGLCENKTAYAVLDFFVNIVRSFPFIILIIALMPLTRLITGTSIGTTATIVPLTLGIAPFLAKMIEASLKEVDKSIIEAARSYGASKLQIIFRVMFVECLPSLINGLTLTLIVVIGFSAMAGTVGGGGLGDVAIRYGYERFKTDIMIETVIVLLVLVQIIQIIGNMLYRISKK
ncbi:methionine ABC transporter permease [Campylobacter sp. MIT 99-7217]|nr:methionine ABC transporter permease [Campylobacter sp. MIT 99-7217]